MDRLTFFLALLHVYKALGEDRFWDTTIKLAETVTLECVHPLALNLTQIEWFRMDTAKKESIAIFHPDYGKVVRDPYVGRVDLLESPSARDYRILSIRNASEADVGFYSCLLDTFPHGSWEKVIQVVPSDRFETAVSPDIDVVSETGKNVTLTYELQKNGLMQQVTWEKIQSHQIDLLTRCNLFQGKSNVSRYQRQILSTCDQGMRRSTVTLPHVTASDSGLYRCLFKASSGENETFVVRLTISDDKTVHHYILFTAGGPVLLLLFVILIATIIVIVYKRKQKRIQFKESEGTRNKASNNYRSAPFANQQPDGAGEDVYVNFPTFPRRPKARV
ncbi:CD226 antigen isoform X2 [Pteronotus mesoamericanus]|uniref:CD226 antigen isoform X2 n=1 Tax=Pteronotus mesoamericanus TaxID=1884717 RepID=UPI0023EDA21F|nr:CD226 antigen isoform X2 [Pteronotus parnellii mesoamericanus]